MAISIKDVAKYYAELPHQDKGLELLQIDLSKAGLTSDQCPWAIEFRKEPEALIATPGTSIAARESVRPLGFTGQIDWKNPRCYVSKYFTVMEVTQGDRRRIPVLGSQEEKNILRFAVELDSVREAWGHPLGVSSWFRPKKPVNINAQVGGVADSQHILGWAADIYPLAGGSIFDLQRWLDGRWLDRLGYGARKGFVHLDNFGGGGLDKLGVEGKVRWNY